MKDMNRTGAIDTILSKLTYKTCNGYMPLYTRMDLISKSNDDLILLLLDIDDRTTMNGYNDDDMKELNL